MIEIFISNIKEQSLADGSVTYLYSGDGIGDYTRLSYLVSNTNIVEEYIQYLEDQLRIANICVNALSNEGAE